MRAFTDWLRETFDLRDARVVDVAGGKGTLAYDVLQRTEAAEVCVIDPRRMRRGRLRRRWRDRLDRARDADAGEGEGEGARGREVREPKHVRVYFTRARCGKGDEAERASVVRVGEEESVVRERIGGGRRRDVRGRRERSLARQGHERGCLRADTRSELPAVERGRR